MRLWDQLNGFSPPLYETPLGGVEKGDAHGRFCHGGAEHVSFGSVDVDFQRLNKQSGHEMRKHAHLSVAGTPHSRSIWSGGLYGGLRCMKWVSLLSMTINLCTLL